MPLQIDDVLLFSVRPSLSDMATLKAARSIRLDEVVLFGVRPTIGDLIHLSSATIQSINALPTQAVLAFASLPPAVLTDNPSLVPFGTMLTATFAPTLSLTQDLAPATRAVAMTGFAPVFTGTTSLEMIPAAGALNMARFAPTVLTGTILAPGVSARAMIGFAPTLARSSVFTPITANLTATGRAPTLQSTSALSVGAASISIQSHAPFVSVGADLTIDIDYDIFGEVFMDTLDIRGTADTARYLIRGSSYVREPITGQASALITGVRGTISAERIP